MKCFLLLVCIVGIVFTELSDATETGPSMDKRGLHFFRLRRSEGCIEVSPEMLHLVAAHGICPLVGSEEYGSLNEN